MKSTYVFINIFCYGSQLGGTTQTLPEELTIVTPGVTESKNPKKESNQSFGEDTILRDGFYLSGPSFPVPAVIQEPERIVFLYSTRLVASKDLFLTVEPHRIIFKIQYDSPLKGLSDTDLVEIKSKLHIEDLPAFPVTTFEFQYISARELSTESKKRELVAGEKNILIWVAYKRYVTSSSF